jgi:hypothetical protein
VHAWHAERRGIATTHFSEEIAAPWMHLLQY